MRRAHASGLVPLDSRPPIGVGGRFRGSDGTFKRRRELAVCEDRSFAYAFFHNLKAPAAEAVGTVLERPVDTVYVSFTEALVLDQIGIDVLNGAGQSVVVGPSIPDPGNPKAMLVRVQERSQGSRVVAWRTLSAVGGLALRGSYTISYGESVATAAVAPAMNDMGAEEPIFPWSMLAGIAGSAMPPLASKRSERDIWNLVNYMRSSSNR